MKARYSVSRLAKIGLQVVLWVAFVIVFAGCSASNEQRNAPEAEQGVIDFANWNWKQDGVVPLNGEWRFSWVGKSANVATGKYDSATTFPVPGTWGNTPTGDGQTIDDQGHATYRLKLNNLPRRQLMAIRLPNISTAYQLYIDGKLSVSRGVAGLNAETTTPYQIPATVYFEANKEETDLTLFVSNYDFRKGGIRTELVIGLEQQIKRLDIRHEAQEMIVFGCLIMIGFYHFGLFILRRKELANLFFALLCLFVALRMGMLGEGFIVQWIPGYTWSLAMRTEYISFVLSGWAGFGYFYRMYPEEFRHFSFKLSSACAGILVLITAVAPPVVFTSLLIGYQLYILVFSLGTLYTLVLAGIRRREGAKLAMIGVAGFVLTIVNDMLFYNGWWKSFDLVPFGLLFLIIMNSFIISLRFSQTYERVEQMSAELKDWNNSLELKIAERTEELQRSYATVENAKSELERMEYARTQLVSNISHDLRTPITLLQGYLEALRDRVITDEQQRDATIRLMLTKVEGLNSLIQDLFEISVLEARKVELMVERLTLADWRESLLAQYGLEMRQRGIDYDCRLDNASIATLTVSIDIHRMNRVFANLIYNALRYTPEGGTIEIMIMADVQNNNVKLAITDSGIGVHPADLPFIFDRFYKIDKSRHSQSGGSGLGLAIVKEIVELHGGTIRASNGHEGGCRFEISLPLASGEARHAG
ncbi:ATP-binding protein [Cohnella yongneupensis]|uniref:histidine kinase n=1 Tax=Cohnella yongneupensis TaxID=425006 RepID=A0ABW0R5N7_9BACL